jgi:hypothetical protein
MHPLFPAAALLLAAGLARADGIDVINGERCRRFELMDGHFAVTYHHSMYDRPVTEEYAVAGGTLELRSLYSPSAAVLEYFGITAPGETHAITRRLPEIVMRVATGEAQVLRIGAAVRSLLEFGHPGDRIVMRAATTHDCSWGNNG